MTDLSSFVAAALAAADVAAAVVIVQEAGGRATLLDGTAARFIQHEPTWRGIAASNGRVHDELLRLSHTPHRGRPF